MNKGALCQIVDDLYKTKSGRSIYHLFQGQLNKTSRRLPFPVHCGSSLAELGCQSISRASWSPAPGWRVLNKRPAAFNVIRQVLLGSAPALSTSSPQSVIQNSQDVEETLWRGMSRSLQLPLDPSIIPLKRRDRNCSKIRLTTALTARS
jgi:hypothetical protein